MTDYCTCKSPPGYLSLRDELNTFVCGQCLKPSYLVWLASERFCEECCCSIYTRWEIICSSCQQTKRQGEALRGILSHSVDILDRLLLHSPEWDQPKVQDWIRNYRDELHSCDGLTLPCVMDGLISSPLPSDAHPSIFHLLESFDTHSAGELCLRPDMWLDEKIWVWVWVDIFLSSTHDAQSQSSYVCSCVNYIRSNPSRSILAARDKGDTWALAFNLGSRVVESGDSGGWIGWLGWTEAAEKSKSTWPYYWSAA